METENNISIKAIRKGDKLPPSDGINRREIEAIMPSRAER